MKIVYTAHLRFRLGLRKISSDIPREIFERAKEHYYDALTRHFVAVHAVEFKGRSREMALTYDKKGNLIEMITVHPLKYYQKCSRVKSGRWRKI